MAREKANGLMMNARATTRAITSHNSAASSKGNNSCFTTVSKLRASFDQVEAPSQCSSPSGVRFSVGNVGNTIFLYTVQLMALLGVHALEGQSVVNVSAKEQQARTLEKQIECQKAINNQTEDSPEYCPVVWDTLMCWPRTRAGQIAVQPCPDYIQRFKPHENATRTCMEDGTWYFDVNFNKTWTDLRRCSAKDYEIIETPSSFMEEHLERIRLIYNIGYGISLVSLVLSVIIMIGFKRLRCPRNTIHLNLFFSFILRASFSFMKENLLVRGVGFPFDVYQSQEEDKILFRNDSTDDDYVPNSESESSSGDESIISACVPMLAVFAPSAIESSVMSVNSASEERIGSITSNINCTTKNVDCATTANVEHTSGVSSSDVTIVQHWECKLFFTCFHYILGANYMWICAEALYLYMLISVAVFSEKSSVKWYVLFGWGMPLVFVIPWVIVRAIDENVHCWNTNPTPGYFWIMRGPIVASILVNCVVFVLIIRVLFTKLNAVNSPEANRFRYRKLAKSTLVLIPLFGVHYVIFAGLPSKVDDTAELVQLYFEMPLNSIQGFLVALLFCFLNGEVQSEIKKKWHRFQLTRLHRYPKSRHASHQSTLATYLSRPRESNASVSHMPDVREPPRMNGSLKNKHHHHPDHGTQESIASFLHQSPNSRVSNGNGILVDNNETEPMISMKTFPLESEQQTRDSREDS